MQNLKFIYFDVRLYIFLYEVFQIGLLYRKGMFLRTVLFHVYHSIVLLGIKKTCLMTCA